MYLASKEIWSSLVIVKNIDKSDFAPECDKFANLSSLGTICNFVNFDNSSPIIGEFVIYDAVEKTRGTLLEWKNN